MSDDSNKSPDQDQPVEKPGEAAPAPLAEALALGEQTRTVLPPVLPELPPGHATVTIGSPSPPEEHPPQDQGFAMPSSLGRFEITRLLGEGAFGRVYEAYDPVMKRVVALKVAKHLSEKHAARFLREAQAAGLLTHPNIVAVYDSGQEGEQHYMAAALVQGKPLCEEIQDRPLQPRRAAEIVQKLAEALAYAHKKGVIHRDVKPSNVMLRDDGEPLLMDFGLARRADEEEKLSVAGQFMGTPDYTAPEQWKGEATPASDQYSLGCLLFELLSGQTPFAGGSAAHYLMLHESAPVPALPGLPRDLETIVRKCLEKEQARRFADCQELADDLGRWLAGEPTKARPVGPLERLWLWGKREPALAASLASVAGILLISSLLAWGLASWAWREKGRADREARSALNNAEMAQQREKEKEAEKNRADIKALEALEAEKRVRDQLLHTEVVLYSGQLTKALREWKDGKQRQAIEALQECQWNVRHWEHHHLWTLFHSNQFILEGHAERARSVAFSPDGRWLVSGSDDNSAKVWDAFSGQQILTLMGHAGPVRCVAFSPNARHLLSSSTDRKVTVWDARSGQALLDLLGHTDDVTCAAFSPDSKRIVSASRDKVINLWDAQTGQLLLSLKGHADSVWNVTFSPDGKRIVSGSDDQTVKVWDVQTGQELLTYSGHSASVWSVAFSPDGATIVSGGDDHTVRVWDAHTGRATLELKGHTDGVLSVAFSPDGRHIISGGQDRTVKVWGIDEKQELLSLKGHTDAITSVVFSPDGRRLASASLDKTLRMWDVELGKRLPVLKTDHFVECVAFSPDGRRLASGGRDGSVTLRDTETRRELVSLNKHSLPVSSVAFSLDGAYLLSGSHDKTVVLWDINKRLALRTFKGHTGEITCSAFHPTGKHIVSGSRDHTLRVWDVQTATLAMTLKGHKGEVLALAYSKDGRRLVSSSKDETLKVWDTEKGEELFTFTGHTESVLSVVFNPAGTRIASGSSDYTVKVWDAEKGEELRSLKGHTGNVTCIAFSSDGKRIFSGSEDWTIKVWDAETGQEVLSLIGQTGRVNCLAISPDQEHQMVAGSSDRTLTFWEAHTRQRAFALKGHRGDVLGLSFSPDGRHLVSGGIDRTVKVWDAEKGREARSLKAHTKGVHKVGFNSDATRIATEDEEGNRHDFDARTGKLVLPDNTLQLQATKLVRHPTNGSIAKIRGSQILVCSPNVVDDHNDQRILDRSGDAFWHAKMAQQAEWTKDWFIAAFHLEWLRRYHPNDESVRKRLILALRQAPQHAGTQALRHRAEAFSRNPLGGEAGNE